jgi:hypothetical protein
MGEALYSGRRYGSEVREFRHRHLLERAERIRCIVKSELVSWTAMIKEAGIEPE